MKSYVYPSFNLPTISFFFALTIIALVEKYEVFCFAVVPQSYISSDNTNVIKGTNFPHESRNGKSNAQSCSFPMYMKSVNHGNENKSNSLSSIIRRRGGGSIERGKFNRVKSTMLASSSSSSTTAMDDESSDDNKINGITHHHNSVSRWPSNDALDKRIYKIALPCIANFAINPLIGAVDLFWVGRMGNALAIAGQAAANQVFSSTFWLVSYLPSVTATLVSKEHAKNDKEGVQDAICQAMFLGFIISIFGTGLMLTKPDLVLKSVLQADAPAMEFAKPYLFIRAFSFLPSLITTTSFAAFRGILDTVTPLQISLFSNFFNAVFDPILIFNQNMGVRGAAYATLAAEIISAVTFLKILFQRKMVRWSKLLKLPQWATLKPLLLGGLALQLRNLALNITFLSVARVTQSIDNSGVSAAAHSIAIQVFQVGGVVLLAMSTVAQTLVPNEMVPKVDQKTGEIKSGGIRAAKALVNRLMSWGFVLGSILGAFQILLLPMIHKFTPIVEVQEAARVPSLISSILQIINGLVFIGEGVMIGCGNFLTLSLTTVVATIGILAALQVFPQKYGLAGVWMGFGVFNILRLSGVILHQKRIGPIALRNIIEKEKEEAIRIQNGSI
eukprot:CAMPEP_0178950594 /NCGR_PEP_ID=MMETSP0789-20121207/6743_1 /TAXON_ID=3005 /ORGANISM="Rhizosolenia setigera, Strain CCMP 1694" /LENGTH=614 /DNA_ID=CAMNT_0020631345 /DNA_START=369 /DNA_END=2213 /DNA_ORIENTATION=+